MIIDNSDIFLPVRSIYDFFFFFVKPKGGYGSTLLNVLRCNTNIEFPITLGRDFCGVVTRKGMSVREDIQIGDKVWGVVPPHRSGCHAEYVVVDESWVNIEQNYSIYIILLKKLITFRRFHINLNQ